MDTMLLNFKHVNITSKEELYKYVSQEEIMYHYYGDFKVNSHNKCPFSIEKNPSFHIHYYENELRWCRFGMFDNHSFDVVNLVMKLYDLNFYQALNKIYQEIYLNQNRVSKSKLKKIRKKKFVEKQELKVIYTKQWTDPAMEYWRDYHITDSGLLVKHDIYPLKEAWHGPFLFHRYTKEEPFYIYIHDIAKKSFTTYLPISHKDDNIDRRFRKNNTAGHVMGLDNCKGGDVGFITSSMKDIVVLDLIGFDSIAPHTESGWNYKEFLEALAYMKKKYKYVYTAFDNDETGIRESDKIARAFKLNKWFAPSLPFVSDPSDFIKISGEDDLLNSIKEKFKKDEIQL